MRRSDITPVLLQSIAFATLVLMMASAPAAVAAGVLLSGSPPLQRLVGYHSGHCGPDLAASVHIDPDRRGR
jgi:hypothetical protein